MDSSVTFGEELTVRRKQTGLSQSAAARKAGVARGTWRAWEKGESEPFDYNYANIEHAMGWQAGSVELAISKHRKPVVAPRRIDVDRLRDQTEKDMWAMGKEANHPEERIWYWIDKRRADIADNAQQNTDRRDHGKNSA